MEYGCSIVTVIYEEVPRRMSRSGIFRDYKERKDAQYLPSIPTRVAEIRSSAVPVVISKTEYLAGLYMNAVTTNFV